MRLAGEVWLWGPFLGAVALGALWGLSCAGAEEPPDSPLVAGVIPLWSEPAPGALGDAPSDRPTLTIYPAPGDVSTGAAMVICPGGGYARRAEHEGAGYAKWLAEHGVTGIVLAYRVGSDGYRHPVMLQDAARAVRTVRANADEWGIDRDRIGIMGSSAGGHLAATLLTHFDAGDPDAQDPIDRESSRPDLGILCYPVITMGEFSHAGSRENLLGKEPSPELIAELSNENQVTADTPPCFIWHTWEDRGVPVENSLAFAGALREHGVPFDLHVYQAGGHGMGLGKRDGDPAALHPWTDDCLYWLQTRDFTR